MTAFLKAPFIKLFKQPFSVFVVIVLKQCRELISAYAEIVVPVTVSFSLQK